MSTQEIIRRTRLTNVDLQKAGVSAEEINKPPVPGAGLSEL